MKWTSTYSCNIEEIDAQHKQLFEIGDRLYVLALETASSTESQELALIFKELNNYIHNHFTYEEDLMRRFRYPGIEDHISEHSAFVKYINEIEAKKNIKSDMVTEMILYFMNWISSHILVSDKKYAKFITNSRLS